MRLLYLLIVAYWLLWASAIVPCSLCLLFGTGLLAPTELQLAHMIPVACGCGCCLGARSNPSLGYVGRSWGDLEPILGLWPMLAHLGPMLAQLGPMLGHLGPMLSLSWAYVGLLLDGHGRS